MPDSFVPLPPSVFPPSLSTGTPAPEADCSRPCFDAFIALMCICIYCTMQGDFKKSMKMELQDKFILVQIFLKSMYNFFL